MVRGGSLLLAALCGSRRGSSAPLLLPLRPPGLPLLLPSLRATTWRGARTHTHESAPTQRSDAAATRHTTAGRSERVARPHLDGSSVLQQAHDAVAHTCAVWQARDRATQQSSLARYERGETCQPAAQMLTAAHCADGCPSVQHCVARCRPAGTPHAASHHTRAHTQAPMAPKLSMKAWMKGLWSTARRHRAAKSDCDTAHCCFESAGCHRGRESARACAPGRRRGE
jgi:hypothetical protein